MPDTRRRRKILLILVLGVLVTLLFLQRNRWATMPNSFAKRSIAEGRLDDAGGWLDLSAKLSPRNAETELLQAKIARKQGRMAAVQKHLERADERGVSAERLQREQWLALAYDGRMREAAPHMGELMLESAGDEQEVLEAYVVGALKSQNRPLAKRLLAVWTDDFPQAAEPHFFRGVMAQDDRSWGPAVESFQTALRLDPGHSRAPLHLAHCLLDSKRPQEAVPYFQQAIESPATAIEAKIGMATCLVDLGRSDEARALLDQVLQAAPDNTEAQLELARLDAEAGQFEDSLKRVEPLHERHPRNMDIRYVLATALRGAGRVEESKRHFDAIAKAREALREAAALTELASPTVEQRHQVGATQLRHGEPKMGIFWLRSALDQDPDHIPTHQTLAAYYGQKADQDPAFRKLAQRHRRELLRLGALGQEESD